MLGPSNPNSLLTTKQLAEMLGVSVATIERWRAHGKPELPPHIRLSSGALRYQPIEVQNWLASKSTKPNIKTQSGAAK